tara:strand:- start:3442 stop:5346 length:1905 start_codon:yes stop_codon:yes gene_type:complete
LEKSPIKTGWTNLLILLATGIVSFVVSSWTGSMASLLAAVYCGIGVLVAFVSLLQMRHEHSEELERLELDKLKGRDPGSALFESGEDILRAKRARVQFEKYFIPGWTILLVIILAAYSYFMYGLFSKPESLRDPLRGTGMLQAAFFLAMALIQFLFGKYSVGLARYDNSRLLRPGGGFLMLASLVSVLVSVASVAYQLGYPKYDLHLAYALTAILALLSVEYIINMVMEIYRPRRRGAEVTLLYESRLVGMLGQPGGIFATAAHTLDYQFGFKVSETWFYQYLERAIVWMLLLWAGVFLVSSCFVVLEPYEEGLLERFGRPVKEGVIGPGLTVKMPWPIDKVYRYPTKAVQRMLIGVIPDPELEKEKVLVWTKTHYKEEFNMLVASREIEGSDEDDESEENRVPVNLLTASIPVQYEIRDLGAWARNHTDAGAFLERLAYREIVRYLVSVDFERIMSSGREQAAIDLRDRIQEEADRHEVGAHILFVGLQDIHPPVDVAQSWIDAQAAIQERETKILTAEAEAASIVPRAEASSRVLVLDAEAQKLASISKAIAESGQFSNKVSAYVASPEAYLRRTYLKTLVTAINPARKYIMATTNSQDVYWLNLEDNLQDEFLNVSFNDETGEMPDTGENE